MYERVMVVTEPLNELRIQVVVMLVATREMVPAIGRVRSEDAGPHQRLPP
jgi:hypothetical protein